MILRLDRKALSHKQSMKYVPRVFAVKLIHKTDVSNEIQGLSQWITHRIG